MLSLNPGRNTRICNSDRFPDNAFNLNSSAARYRCNSNDSGERTCILISHLTSLPRRDSFCPGDQEPRSSWPLPRGTTVEWAWTRPRRSPPSPASPQGACLPPRPAPDRPLPCGRHSAASSSLSETWPSRQPFPTSSTRRRPAIYTFNAFLARGLKTPRGGSRGKAFLSPYLGARVYLGLVSGDELEPTARSGARGCKPYAQSWRERKGERTKFGEDA